MSGKGEIVPGPEAVVVVVIRPVVVPIPVERASVGSVAPIASAHGEQLRILSAHPIRNPKAANPSADHRAQFVNQNG